MKVKRATSLKIVGISRIMKRGYFVYQLEVILDF